MNKRIVINPLTRISGFLEIDVRIENNIVVDAQTKGNLFRGFEQMLVGRSPFDAVYFTQRICGICSAAHSMASSLALEDALNIKPVEQGRYLRDIIHCCEFLQNHIRRQDKISRIGGEEFVILLEDLEQQEAYTIAERIRHSIAHTPIRYQGQTIGLSISIGMTFFSHANQVDAALLDADQLLYDAKKMGRNQVQYSELSYMHETV